MSRECSTCQSTGIVHERKGDDEWVHSDCPDCDGGVPEEWAADYERINTELDAAIAAAADERTLIRAVLTKHLYWDRGGLSWGDNQDAFADELVTELARWRDEQPVDYDQEVTHQWTPYVAIPGCDCTWCVAATLAAKPLDTD